MAYYGYRYYDPMTGRWPSRDPIGEIGRNHKWFEAQGMMLEIERDCYWQMAKIQLVVLDHEFIASFEEDAIEELSDLRDGLYVGDLLEIMNMYQFLKNNAISSYDYLGLSKGGKRNIGCEGFNLRSAADDVAAALKDAIKNGQKARAAQLRGLLKVIKRGELAA